VEHHQTLTYAIILLGLIFEGEVIIISTGILAHLGALNIWFAIIFILCGAVAKTFFGYALGGYLYQKYHHNGFFRYIQKRVYSFLPRFKEQPFWSVFVSKFIMGANNIVILFSGYEKIEYKNFVKAELIATFIWAPLLLSLGYFFSYTALSVSRDVWKFLAVVLVLFIIFILFDKLVSWLYELFEEFYDDNS
jgi:membrane protein DedA with SNARE-associated domain